MISKSAQVQVNLPLMLLGLSTLGGLAGGGIAYLVKKNGKLKAWRIVIGMVAGFVLYWFCLYLGLGHLAHAVVLNPLSAFILSLLGGWSGTSVFDMAGKKLGLSPS